MVNEELIVKFLAGEAEDHEVFMLNEWRNKDEENEKRFLQLEKLWDSSAGISDKTEFDTDKAWQNVARRTAESPSKIKLIPIRRVWYAAASLVILCVLSVMLYYNTIKEVPMMSSVAEKGRLNIQLSDGSSVLLKEGRLDYPEKFSGNKREVKLKTGTAYFKVSHNKEMPFEITADGSTVTVLGTEFEVSNTASETRVKVHSGRVRFQSPGGESILTAGKTAVFSKTIRGFKTVEEAENNSLAYATGKLEFKNSTLKDVVADLNAFYTDKVISIDPLLENCRLTATFENEKNLENVLEVMRVTMKVNIRWDKKSNRYLIEGRGCAS